MNKWSLSFWVQKKRAPGEGLKKQRRGKFPLLMGRDKALRTAEETAGQLVD